MDFIKQIYYVLTYFLETIKKDLTKRFKIIEIKIYFRNRTGHYYLENNLFSYSSYENVWYYARH